MTETPEVEAVMRVLADHRVSEAGGGTASAAFCNCTCGVGISVPGGLRLEATARGRAHVAREVVAALDPVMRKAKAEAHDEGHITACPVKGCEGLGRNPYQIEADDA